MSEFAGYAYPSGPGMAHTLRGLTKRELFAAMALQGLLSRESVGPLEGQVWAAVVAADALVEALK